MTELWGEMDNWASVIKPRGYPYLFQSLDEFKEFGNVIKNLSNKWDVPISNINVQGSTLRNGNLNEIGDVDIAIKVDISTFDELVARFKDLVTNESIKNRIGKNGKIGGIDMKGSNGTFTGEFYKDFKNKFGSEFPEYLGVPKIQLSIIKEGSNIDVSPFLQIN